jgi:oxygen-independent coproporphyrinogen-3 oxidase
MEANPDTVTERDLALIRQLGIDRISFGVQSTSPEELQLLERTHDFITVIKAVTAARSAGFGNLNLDLIFGLPGQSLASWKQSVQRILGLVPDHVSAYALTLEHGTPFSKWVGRGLIAAPDPDLAADMYEAAGEELEAAGLRQYEISNWARPGHECRHNLQYWRGLPYLGLGAGAHGYWGGIRTSNVLRIASYIARMSAPRPGAALLPYPITAGTVGHHRQSDADEMSDFMLLRLRLTSEGVPVRVFQDRFGRSLSDAYGDEISRLRSQDLVEWTKCRTPDDGISSDVLRLTKRGRLLGNQVFMSFIDSASESLT